MRKLVISPRILWRKSSDSFVNEKLKINCISKVKMMFWDEIIPEGRK